LKNNDDHYTPAMPRQASFFEVGLRDRAQLTFSQRIGQLGQ